MSEKSLDTGISVGVKFTFGLLEKGYMNHMSAIESLFIQKAIKFPLTF
jgi:hypothetical protein